MSAKTAVLEWGHERARVGTWRAGTDVALLSPTSDSPLPTAAFLQRCLRTLADEGYAVVLTAALAPSEQAPFLAAGFVEHERLRLLSHDLRRLASPPPVPIRRAGDADRPAVLAVDALCFSAFWQLDDLSLQEAIDATPAARFAVALGARDEVVGYAVCGRTSRRGYVQRLGVHPAWRGRRIGSALVLDGLRWMHRKGVERAVVNTQLDNRAAQRLYLRLGFREEPGGLAVLRQDLR